ncbi:hypothetical protein ACFSJY_00720 [Thalassotalea euphylliae]|uniref:hypothetical protein n=1 Tax=Thalassotalea euphylliae TaxID=1655234 RepID=UPI00363427C7
MNTDALEQSPREKATKSNTINLAIWTSLWLISQALSIFGKPYVGTEQQWIVYLLVAANVGTGIMMILANKKHLLGLDELQQRIHLNAMGITLGVGLVFGIAYSTLTSLGVIEAGAEISHLMLAMGISYIVMVLLGTKHYS